MNGNPLKSTKEPDTFGTELKLARESKGYTQRIAAKILNVRRLTITRWESEKSQPDARDQETIISAIREAREAPSARRIAHARRHHHIDWENGRGWFMRVTFNVSAKVVGRRIKFRLRTRDIEEAIKRRDVIFSSYKAIGFKVDSKGVVTVGKRK